MSVATREPVPPSLDDELAQLADEIRQHHKSVERHARAMLFEAIVAGEKLLSVKERLRHGEFGRFVAYSGVPWRSANDYVKLAANSQRCEVLEADSIRAALRALAKPRKPKKKEPNFGPPGVVGAWEQSWKEAMIAQGRDPQEVEGRYEWWDAKKKKHPPRLPAPPGTWAREWEQLPI